MSGVVSLRNEMTLHPCVGTDLVSVSVLGAISLIRNEPQALTPPLRPGSPTLLAQVTWSSRNRRARRKTLDGLGGHSMDLMDTLDGHSVDSVDTLDGHSMDLMHTLDGHSMDTQWALDEHSRWTLDGLSGHS